MAIGTATAIIGGSLLGAAGSVVASRGASRATSNAASSANAEQARQYDLSRQDLAPYRNIGTQALGQLGSLYGFSTSAGQPGPSGMQSGYGGQADYLVNPRNPAARFGREPVDRAPQTAAQQTGVQPGGMDAFFASPDYNFRRTEGQRGIEQSAAARGGAFSGNALRALNEYNSNLAAGEFGDYFNRLAALSGIGQAATNQGVVAGQNYANQYGANTMAAGDARASGILSGYAGIGNAVNSGLNNYLLYRGGYFGSPGTPPYVPSGSSSIRRG